MSTMSTIATVNDPDQEGTHAGGEKRYTSVNDGGGFHESLRALREILTLDTPTFNLLKGDQYEFFRSEIKTLRKGLQKELGEVKALQTELEEVKNEMVQQQKLGSTLEETYEALNKHKAVLVEQITSLKFEKEQLYKELQSANDCAELMNEKLQNEIEALHKKIAKAEGDQKKAEEMVGFMEAKTLTSEKKVEEMQMLIETMVGETKKETALFQAKIAILEADNKRFEIDLRNIEQKMKSQNSSDESKQQDAIAKLKQESAEGNALLDRWKTDLTEAQLQVEVLTLTLSLSHSHQKEAQQALGDAKAQQEELKTKLDEAIQENEKIKLELEDVQKSSAEVLAQKETLLGSNGWLLNDLEKMRDLAKKKESANQVKHKAAIKVLEDEVDDAKDALACAVEEVIRSRGKVTEMEKELQMSKETNGSLEKAMQMLKEENARLREAKGASSVEVMMHDDADETSDEVEVDEVEILSEETSPRKRTAESDVNQEGSNEAGREEEMSSLKAKMMAKKYTGKKMKEGEEYMAGTSNAW